MDFFCRSHRDSLLQLKFSNSRKILWFVLFPLLRTIFQIDFITFSFVVFLFRRLHILVVIMIVLWHKMLCKHLYSDNLRLQSVFVAESIGPHGKLSILFVAMIVFITINWNKLKFSDCLHTQYHNVHYRLQHRRTSRIHIVFAFWVHFTCVHFKLSFEMWKFNYNIYQTVNSNIFSKYYQLYCGKHWMLIGCNVLTYVRVTTVCWNSEKSAMNCNW